MRKAATGIVVFVIVSAALSFAARAQQGDLVQMAKDLTAGNKAQRAEAYRLATLNGWPVRGEGPNGSFFELQKMLNGMPAYYTTDNANAARTTNTDSTNLAIGGGNGFVLRIWDGGAPRITHQELTGRVTWNDINPYSPIGHATHTSGTLVAAGVVAQAKGMAYAASLRAFEWNNDLGEMTSEASGGMLLSNHSYGYTRGWYYNSGNGYFYWYGDTAISEQRDYEFGFYDSESQQVDQITSAAPNYLPVVSASNDRGEGPTSQPVKHYYYDARFGQWRFSTKTRQLDGGTAGYDCIPNGMQLSKNTLTVGAVMAVPSYTGPGSVVMTTFSSWGPADDGRIKPDVVGDGYQVYSSYYLNDASYAIGDGTSMSSPNVCGSLALLADYYRDTHSGTAMWASTLKGLAIHTARECGANPGPDYSFGWGLLNTYAAYRILNEDHLDDAKGYIEQLTLAQGQTIDLNYRVAAGTPELKATISWTDPAGTPPSPSLDPRTKMLVNDLDLRAIKGASTYYPWRLDVYNPSNAATKTDNSTDNVEVVSVSTPAAGVYTIRISHKGTLYGSSQKVSLIVSGAERNHVWHVYADGSGDAPTIAAAVTGAADGDSIYVHPGTYPEAGISISKALVITGVGGAALTTVDGASLGAGCFTFPVSTKVISISGLTIKGGSSTILGGGIYCSNSSVTIERCVFDSCYASYYGGGLAVTNASPAVRNCVFTANQADHDGGGLYASGSSSVFDSCLFYDNSAAGLGGGIGVINGGPQFRNCTIHHNSAGTHGAGVSIGANGNPTLERCLVTSGGGGGGGIWGDPAATGATVDCCDVYGNAGGDYAGSISDRTGTNGNVSLDPIYCDPDAAPRVLTISTLSPCAPTMSPCGQLIGALGTGCLKGPDLAFALVAFTSESPSLGDSVRATVRVKNVGLVDAAEEFYIDYYRNLASAPAPGTPGEQRLLVAGLAAGDSVDWTTDWEKASTLEAWTSWFRVDTGDSVLETDEGNNLAGPYDIMWGIPIRPGWPALAGLSFHSSPAVAGIDSNETTLETVVGCDDGNLYVLRSDGTNAPGWPVTIGDTLFSSPAAANITGDYHREVVIGARNGSIYAFDYLGTQLWHYATGHPIYTTPALVDLDRDGWAEVLATSGDSLYVLEGNGTPYPGSWPYSAGGGTMTSPAAGDVDGDGSFEIAVVAGGYPSSAQSTVSLLRADGTLYGPSWPVTADTVVTADPVLGDVLSPSSDLEIVAGGLSGAVYVWKTDGSLWADPPRVTGAIERSPILTQIDADAELEIVVTSARHILSPPEHWEGMVTAIDDDGSIEAGWPRDAGGWVSGASSMPSAVSIGASVESVVGSPADSLRSWDGAGEAVYGFPIDLGGDVLVSAAAGDLDDDGVVEIIAAATGGGLRCYELPASISTASELWWPMFRYDRGRTGCYGFVAPTGVDEGEGGTPPATRISSIYPNPFNPSTRIAFDLGARGRVELAVYDVSGRKIAVLLDRRMEAGRHEIAWDGRTLSGGTAASGVYFCALRAGGVVETRKMVLLR